MDFSAVLPGIPQQQGSKTRGANGVSFEANKKLKPWRADAISVLQDHYQDDQPISEPVHVHALFRFPRPKSHYRTGRYSGQVKDSAPYYRPSPPDLDKLERALGDALTQAGVIKDDALIVGWHCLKTYTSQRPHTELRIRWGS